MSAALEAAEVLASRAPADYAPAKVDGPHVHLDDPSSAVTLSAAAWLRDYGIGAHADLTDSGWAVRIAE